MISLESENERNGVKPFLRIGDLVKRRHGEREIRYAEDMIF